MLKLPGKLTADTFLKRHWQKRPLFMPRALPRITPALTRNELGWLATLDDVESRLVFVDRSAGKPRYSVETGPFDAAYLQALPKRDWSLLIHDVEKHLPTMRELFRYVPFVPEWRIDDLMVSFAAPGGGVGPHRDHYDVFLCQGTGVRNWRFTNETVADDAEASDDLALLAEFESKDNYDTVQGDVLYLPPGVAHWGTAKRACITYSLGMRAPQADDLAALLELDSPNDMRFYSDTDLASDEAGPGYISGRAAKRALKLLGLGDERRDAVSESLGLFATQPKDWLRPIGTSAAEAEDLLAYLQQPGAHLDVHGMALLAFDRGMMYVNGSSRALRQEDFRLIQDICANRSVSVVTTRDRPQADTLLWMLCQGAFEIPENS